MWDTVTCCRIIEVKQSVKNVRVCCVRTVWLPSVSEENAPQTACETSINDSDTEQNHW